MSENKIMLEENVTVVSKIPSVDFSFQFNMAKEKVERKIFGYLSEIATDLHKRNQKQGALIVFGSFGTSSGCVVEGVRRLGNDSLQKYVNVMFAQFRDEVMKIFTEGTDGAIIISEHGQILGNRIYLMVDNPSLSIPEGTGTRHISAASFSCREDVTATFTLSEETLDVRMWKDGSFIEQFHPTQVDEE